MSNQRVSVAVLVCFTAGVAWGCGQSPVRPASLTSERGTAQVTPGDDLIAGLIDGTLTLTAPGGTIQGSYTGEATIRGRAERAEIAVTLTGGTGRFSGASGALTGRGTGAFTGEGSFSLVLTGRISTGDAGQPVAVSLRGSSAVGCVAETTVVTQEGSGSIAGAGRVTATLSHRLGSGGGCSG